MTASRDPDFWRKKVFGRGFLEFKERFLPRATAREITTHHRRPSATTGLSIAHSLAENAKI